MSALYSALSSLRCSVAPTTALSSERMPALSAAISSVRLTMAPSISPMAVTESESESSNSFFLSSDSSSLDSQYSFLLSSPVCSAFRLPTISSIMTRTFSKPTFLPCRARASKSSSGRFRRLAAAWIFCNAWALSAEAETWICMKLALALGKVFLKRSKAESSLRTLIVSPMATSSSARVFLTASHSAAFVEQPASNSALNFWSCASVSFVSSRSPATAAISTPRVPTRSILSSICCCNMDSSLFLATMSPS
mmetsp:Transcript_25624/g.65117  ORF Transcript_25624/g.65117 Transcript_25624/m.65117 type:complete len:252 (-) Transcript_25624:562-1317(-)